jgi:PncC family amidohydrolase
VAERAPSNAELVTAARRLGDKLRGRGWQLATAESCTGGLIGHVLTEVPRSSDHYLGGVVSYSDLLKRELLGVDAELLERTGAVSADVAEAMAAGMLRRFEVASLALAVTGIAGPDGGSAEKPVGLVYVAAIARGGPARVERRIWPHDRAGNKAASALLAIEMGIDLARDTA